VPALCPEGTMSNILNVPDSRSCPKCPKGYFCGSKGMTAVTVADKCDAGFICILGSTVPDPRDGITGDFCPAGSYCDIGCGNVDDNPSCPFSCPDGTYNPLESAKEAVSCLKCLPGSFCNGLNSASPAGLCEEGYWCPEGSKAGYKTELAAGPTDAGYYAPVGSDVQIPCS